MAPPDTGSPFSVLTAQLQAGALALGALAIALEGRAGASPPNARIAAAVDAVVAALGVRDYLAGLDAAAARALAAEVRVTLAQASDLVRAGGSLGWQAPDDALLDAAGAVSAAFPERLATRVAPLLDGLSARLAARGAVCLDAGVGVGALAVALARQWPHLHVVGIDPLERALVRARERIAREGVAERITLRAQGIEDVRDVAAYDLIWVPGLFVPGDAIASALPHLRRALRPGGWLLMAHAPAVPDPVTDAVNRLRTVLAGGTLAEDDVVDALLRSAGFTEVRRLPSAPTALVVLVAARPPVASAADDDS